MGFDLNKYLEDNQWLGTAYFKTERMQHFFNQQYITNIERAFPMNIPRYFDPNNIQTSYKISMQTQKMPPMEIFEKTDEEVKGVLAEFKEAEAKVFYGYQAFRIDGVESILRDPKSVNARILDIQLNYWPGTFEKLVNDMFVGIAKKKELSIGDDKTIYQPDSIRELLLTKKEFVNQESYSIYMNIETLKQCLKDDKNKSIKPQKNTIIQGSMSKISNNYVYDDLYEININNYLEDGYIYLIADNSMGFSYLKDFKSLTVGEKKLAASGTGITTLVTHAMFMVHPRGFTYNSTRKPKKEWGLSENELRSGNFYDLQGDVDTSPILSLRIKMDSDNKKKNG